MDRVPGRRGGLSFPTVFAALLLLSGCSAPDTSLSPAAAGSPANVQQTQVDESAPVAEEVVPGELLVKFRSRATDADVQRSVHAAGVEARGRVGRASKLMLVRFPSGRTAHDVILELEQQDDVEYAEPNYILRKNAVPDDPRFPDQWALNNTGAAPGHANDADIDAPEAWDIRSDAFQSVIAIIDTGVDYTHADLAPNIFRNTPECTPNGVDDDGNGYIDDCRGIDAANNDTDPMDDDGHGTHVAGIAAARGNNGIGIAGVAWNAQILPCKFLDDSGAGSTADAIECLDYIAALKDRGVNIVATNNSWGDGINSLALADAISRQQQRGILFVAAAGNDSMELVDSWRHRDGAEFPCAYPHPIVVCVGNSTPGDVDDVTSNHSHQVVDVFAPGKDILSTLPHDSYGTATGTSMAAPHVTGLVALMTSSGQFPDWRALRSALLAGGEKSPVLTGRLTEFDAVSGRRVNAAGALACSGRTVTGRVLPASLGARIVDRHVGETMALQVLNIGCASPAGNVTVQMQPGNVSLTLLDNGIGTDAVAGDGIYSANWTPSSAGTFEFDFPGQVLNDVDQLVADHLTVVVDGMLKWGFPVRALHSSGTIVGGQMPTVVGNIDSTPQLEIVATGLMNGPTYAWNSIGARIAGFPRTISVPGRDTNQSAFLGLGRLTLGSSAASIIAGYGDGYTATRVFSAGLAEVYAGDGTLLPGWPSPTSQASMQAPVAADIDGDGLDEIFSVEVDGHLHGYRRNGSALPGFPTSQFFLHVLAADLDNDGIPELVGQGDLPVAQVLAVRADGSSMPGFPVSLAATHQLIGATFSAIGDVDGDGRVEIVGFATEQTSGGNLSRLVLFSPDGSLKRIVAVPPAVRFSALGDLTGDGIPEIVFTETQTDTFSHTYRVFVHAVTGQGLAVAGWPVEISGSSNIDLQPHETAAKVGDVTGDQQPEVVLIGKSRLQVLSRNGASMPGFPRTLPDAFVFNTVSAIDPVLADIDQDGRSDIVLTSNFWDGRAGFLGKVWVYDVGGGMNGTAPEWGQYRGDAGHAGEYRTGKNLGTEAYVSVSVRGLGSVVSTVPGINCGSDCIERYAKGTNVQLQAVPSGGSTFMRWLGGCSGSGNPCAISLGESKTVVAEFSAPQANLTVTTAGGGTVTSSPAGLQCQLTCTGSFLLNSTVRLTAIPLDTFLFQGWTGACSGSATTCDVTMDSAKSVSATFIAKPQLQVVIAAGQGTVRSTPGTIVCPVLCTMVNNPGAVLQLAAEPAPGYIFDHWSFGCVGTAPNCSVTMDSSKVVSAHFRATQVTFGVSLGGSGSGRVTSAPAGIDCGADCSETYASGGGITLTAIPAPGSTFGGWLGDCSIPDPVCTLSSDSSHAVTAVFFRTVATLNVARTGTGTGTVTSTPAGIDCGSNCVEQVFTGTSLSLLATATADSYLVGWSGGCTGSATTCVLQFPVAAGVQATAEFGLKPLFTVSVSGLGTVKSDIAGIDCGSDCGERYLPNTQVVLTATPSVGNVFSGWSGACTGSAATCMVTVNAPGSAAATFTAAPVVTPPSNPGGGSGSSGGGGGGFDLAALAGMLAMAIARWRVRATAVAVVAAASGCTVYGSPGPASGHATPSSTVSRQIELPTHLHYQVGARRVISDAAQWRQLWQSLGSVAGTPPPHIDFSRNQVVYVALGERAHGGYRVSLRLDLATPGQRRIVVTESVPGANCMTAAVLSYPAAALVVPRQDAYGFVDERIVVDCRAD